MLPKDLSIYSVSDIEKGFQTLKEENDRRIKPLQQLLREGKPITEAEERILDTAGNLIDEYMMVERIKKVGTVAEVSSQITISEKATLELLILKADQARPVDTSKALKCEYKN